MVRGQSALLCGSCRSALPHHQNPRTPTKHLLHLTHSTCSPLLQQLPADLSGLTQLQQLSVRGMPTSLEELPADMTALVDLSDLQLHGCHLMQVCVCVCVATAIARWTVFALLSTACTERFT